MKRDWPKSRNPNGLGHGRRVTLFEHGGVNALRRRHHYLLIWMVVGAAVGLIPTVLELWVGIPYWAGGLIVGALAGAIYQIRRYGL